MKTKSILFSGLIIVLSMFFNPHRSVAENEKPFWKAYWKNGFRIEYQDPKTGREYKFRFRTGIQLRYTYLDKDQKIANSEENYSSFNMRRLRFFVDGIAPNKDWKYYVHVQLEPKNAVNVHDAFVVWQKYKEFKIQFGRMKIPGIGMEYWQSGFMQDGTDRTIFTDDSEGYWPYDGGPRKLGDPFDSSGNIKGTPTLRVGGHLLDNGFPIGGMLNYRSQGILLEGYIDALGKKQFICYWMGWFNGRDTQGLRNTNSDDHLYSFRIGINWLSGSDPKGPMGGKTFKNYFMQGDYGYNTKPALATIFSGFWTKDRRNTYYVIDNAGDYQKESTPHDIKNYGLDFTLLFRYLGFSADIEWAWEEFIQNPEASVSGVPLETWDRMGFRLNLGYFFVPKKWEATLKYAYLNRLLNNTAADSIRSGLGLVKFEDDKYGVENYLQQFVIGLNYYFHGFNQYITFDLSLLQRYMKSVSSQEAQTVGLSEDDFRNDTENDLRFRVMFQQLF